jgi:hypothetical protein
MSKADRVGDMNVKYVANFRHGMIRLTKIEVASETPKIITILSSEDIIRFHFFGNRIDKRAHNIFETKELALFWLEQKVRIAISELEQELTKIELEKREL